MGHPEVPDEHLRSELNLWAQALRSDWPIGPETRKRLLQVAVDLALAEDEPIPAATGLPDDDDEDGGPPPWGVPDQEAAAESYTLEKRVGIQAKRDRTKLAALRVIEAFARNNIAQQKLDFQREVWAAKTRPRDTTDDDVRDALMRRAEELVTAKGKTTDGR